MKRIALALALVMVLAGTAVAAGPWKPLTVNGDLTVYGTVQQYGIDANGNVTGAISNFTNTYTQQAEVNRLTFRLGSSGIGWIGLNPGTPTLTSIIAGDWDAMPTADLPVSSLAIARHAGTATLWFRIGPLATDWSCIAGCP